MKDVGLKSFEILPWVKIAAIGPSHARFLGLVPLGLFQRMLRSLGLLLPQFFSLYLFLSYGYVYLPTFNTLTTPSIQASHQRFGYGF